jgi:hypothetical protein
MARGKIKHDHRSTDIADAIIAEWYRILPPRGSAAGPMTMDASALTAAFNQILGEPRCQAVIDTADMINIAVPLPPKEVTSREELLDYLEKNDEFRQGMGSAVLFGCGR